MIGMRGGDRAEHQVVQHRGCRLSPVQISSLSLHTLVFSTLGLNVKWGVCMCVWLSCKCVCVRVHVCLHGCCVGQVSGHPGRSPYLARLLQLSRQKDECFPHSSPPTSAHTDLTILLSQMWSSPKLTLAPVQLTLLLQSQGSS